MNEKELTKNVEKIKQFLTLPDYDKIDAGIELAVSLEEPKIFEGLLDGCSLGSYASSNLNDWMKECITTSGKLHEPTGYYVWLSLLVNSPLLNFSDIKEMDLTNAYLKKLPINFSKLQNLEKLNLQLNQLDFFPEEIFQLINLKSLHLGWNNISIIPDNISNLKNLESLMIGNNKIGDDISNNLGNLNNLQHLDLGSNGLSKIPDCIFKLKTLKNINLTPEWFADDDPEILKLKKTIPECYIIQPVYCVNCNDEPYRVEDTIERWDEYFCESHDEQWGHAALNCDCCYKYVASRGFTGGADEPFNIGNNDNLKDGYNSVRWFIGATSDVNGNAPGSYEGDDYYEYTEKTIIKKEDGTLEGKFLCELCKPNIPKTDKPSYEDAEKFAEENLIEYWE
jgi:hypothetical protein